MNNVTVGELCYLISHIFLTQSFPKALPRKLGDGRSGRDKGWIESQNL